MKRKIVFHPLMLYLVVLAFAAVYGGGSRTASTVKNIYFTTSTAGDTAAVMFFELNNATASAADSFAYIDTFVLGPTPDTFVATYVSPSQAMYLTIATQTAAPTKVDTTTNVIGCTVVFASQELGIELDLETVTNELLTAAIDSLVDIFNKKTNLKDSCIAQDSGTYMKIVSKYSQDDFTARWSMSLSVDDSLDTTSNICTEAEVAAGMAAACNAEDSIAFYATAINSGDSAWIVTSDDPGLEMVVYLGDTATDTTRTQANVTSSSTKNDTLLYWIPLADDNFRALGIHGDIVLDTSITDSANAVLGIGLSDSASLWIRSYRDSGGVRVYRDLDSVHGSLASGLPVTLHISRIPAWANDTVFFDGLVISWYISDTASDVAVTCEYPIYIDLKLTEM